MVAILILLLVLASLAGSEAPGTEGAFRPPPAAQPEPTSPGVQETPPAQVRWRASRTRGTHSAGRLERAVQLPSAGRHYLTWDFVRERSPNRAWRRWGHRRAVRSTLRVIRAHRRANPEARRVLIGDISRPRGGPFGAQFGAPGHASHQIGLDVDIYYPRRDGRAVQPIVAADVDRRLSQDLVDRFVAAGASKVFVGPNTGLTGPPGIVVPLRLHDDHLHARFPVRPNGG